MYKVHITKTIKATPEQVFAMLADHEGYARFPGVRKAQLVRAGAEERNGVGALRRLSLGPLDIEEEILEYEPPYRLGYRITKAALPIVHDYARITLRPDGEWTQAVWESVLRSRLPLVGTLVEITVGKQMEVMYGTLLMLIGRRLAKR